MKIHELATVQENEVGRVKPTETKTPHPRFDKKCGFAWTVDPNSPELRQMISDDLSAVGNLSSRLIVPNPLTVVGLEASFPLGGNLEVAAGFRGGTLAVNIDTKMVT